MKILFVGDIIGQPGRRCLLRVLPDLRDAQRIDLVVANGENIAHGRGVSESTVKEVLAAGVDVITGGNHCWDQKGSEGLFERIRPLLRPANMAPGVPGRGHVIVESGGLKVLVASLVGRVFMSPADCPFRTADRIVDEARSAGVDLAVVDFHAEATSEKRAMGWHLDGRVAAVVGTHTHVQTADEEILPGGTAYITDLGMTGARGSVIGMQVRPVVEKYLTGLPRKFEVAHGDLRFQGAVVEFDRIARRPISIARLNLPCPESRPGNAGPSC